MVSRKNALLRRDGRGRHREDYLFSNKPAHIHVSNKGVQKRVGQIEDSWRDCGQPCTGKCRRGGSCEPATPRVHTHGWGDLRPMPERPERGRWSQDYNRKPKTPRRKIKKQGDLLGFGDLKNVFLHQGHRDQHPYVEIERSNHQCYSMSCRPAPSGPYMYIGLSRIMESGVSGERTNWYRMLLGSQIIEIDDEILDKMIFLSRVDKAKG